MFFIILIFYSHSMSKALQFQELVAIVLSNQASAQLAMRSLCPEHFVTSEVVLHTCGPTQTVAKCVAYRWSIHYLFVLKEENIIILFY